MLLVKFKQCFVDFKYIVVAVLYETLNYHIKLVAVRQGKACLHQKVFCFVKIQLQSNSKGDSGRFARLIVHIGANFREQPAVNIGFLVDMASDKPFSSIFRSSICEKLSSNAFTASSRLKAAAAFGISKSVNAADSSASG